MATWMSVSIHGFLSPRLPQTSSTYDEKDVEKVDVRLALLKDAQLGR
jgi:hypothetical protein